MAVLEDITWGVGCWQTPDAGSLTEMVRTAERCRFDHFWYGNEKLHADMWVGLTVAALASSRIRVGTFVADPYSLHPAVAAAMIATIDAYSDGRATLLLGAGGSGLRELGLERIRPAETLESAVGVVRALLRGEHVTHEGPAFKVDARLHLPPRPDIPIWLAARAPRVLAAAGRVADGAMLGTIARPEDIAAGVVDVRAAAVEAGRTGDAVTLSVRVDVAVADDAGVARDALRGFVAGILSASWPDRSFVERAGLTIPDDLEEVCRTQDLTLAWDSGNLVPDSFVDAFAWAGTADEVAGRVAAAIDCGIDDVTVMFHPQAGEPATQLAAFAEQVIPRVSALLGRPVGVRGGGR